MGELHGMAHLAIRNDIVPRSIAWSRTIPFSHVTDIFLKPPEKLSIVGRMARRTLRVFHGLLGLLLGVTTSGCGVMAAGLFSAGAETASATGVSYTMDNIAYKTFVLPVEPLLKETFSTLQAMGFPIENSESHVAGVHIIAHGPNTAHPMDIEIDLETLSQKTTRMRVVVKRGVVQKDAATAGEIIAVTTQRLHYPPKELATAGL